MRMIFRCDPGLSDHLPRAGSGRATALPDWLRAIAFEGAFGNPRPRHSHRQTMPAFRRRDGLWRHGFCCPATSRWIAARFSWDWDIPEPATSGHPRAPLSFHPAAQLAGAPFARGHARPRSSSTVFWTIEP